MDKICSNNKKVLVVDLPQPNEHIKGCWYNGYPIHKGRNKKSLNYAGVYANKYNILPDQNILKTEYYNFLKVIRSFLSLDIIPFPDILNQKDNLCHDAIFIRDSGLCFKNYWIKAHFGVQERSIESDIYAPIISEKYNKEIISLPEECYIEFGEVYYLETKNGSFYFGGISRANNIAHEVIREIIKPDVFILIDSEGYHLDTVFCPLINKSNELVGCILASDMIKERSLRKLMDLGLELIKVDAMDSSGKGKLLGNYAINAFISPGLFINSSDFITCGVEEKIKFFGIEHIVTPLSYFRYAGGSCHCLTNEIYIL